MNAEYIASAAEELIERFQSRDPEYIARRLGIKIYYEPLGSLLGFYTHQWGYDLIFINSDADEELYGLTAAHELGHAILHRDMAQLRAFSELAGNTSTDKAEYEANAFAAHLLIDNTDVISRLRVCETMGQMAYALGVREELLRIKLREMGRLGMLGEIYQDTDARFLRGAGI